MYANAIYKPRVAAAETLAALIEEDHADFVKKWPGLQVKIDGDLRTRDGVLAKTWRMEPPVTSHRPNGNESRTQKRVSTI
jgi:hypothetical protein